MRRVTRLLPAIAALLLPLAASAQTDTRRVAIVTQVQGAVFYRTSITIGNDNSTKTIALTLIFSYRSPVDGTFQSKGIAIPALAPHHAVFYEDIVQTFKDAGALRAQDVSAALFGTLLVKQTGTQSDDDISVVARTYSPATGGGTNGIAYSGRVPDESGGTKIQAALRDGSFGHDGTTRANIGFINTTGSPVDIQVIYFDGDSGAMLKAFKISDITHHLLEAEEVFQINNVFTDASVPAATTKIVVEAIPLTAGRFIEGYVVQLDGTTNDGSFFPMTEFD